MSILGKIYNFIIDQLVAFFSNSKVQVGSFILYKLLVDLIYILYSGHFSNYGVQISKLNVVTGYMMAIMLSYWIVQYCRTEIPSSYIMIVINMVYFIPITTYCSMGPGSSGLLLAALLYALCLSILWKKIPVVVKKKEDILSSNKFFYCLFVIVSILTIYISIRYTGLRVHLSLSNVYEIRAEATTYGLPIILSYIQNFLGILISMLILFFIFKKNIFFSIISIGLLVLQYSFEARKSIFFMGILLIFGCFFWKKKMIYLIVPGGSLLGILALLEIFFTKHGYIIDYFFRRQGYVLAQLSDRYYRFFLDNPRDVFRSTFLGKLGFDSPYSLSLSKVIGNNFTSQNITCNNGLLADVWAHIGWGGIIIMPIILIICFRVLDYSCCNIQSKYYIGLAIFYGIAFANTTWSTVLLTHGFGFLCLLFMIFPKEKPKNELY